MIINSSEKSYKSNSVVFDLINYLKKNQSALGLIESNLYYDFPVFKDLDNDILICDVLIISKYHGIIAFTTIDSNNIIDVKSKLNNLTEKTDHLYSTIFSRLLRNKLLRSSKTSLLFDINSIIFIPYIDIDSLENSSDSTLVDNYKDLSNFIKKFEIEELKDEVYNELISTIEGAKGLIKPKERAVDKSKKRGSVVNEIEKEIISFDQHQKIGFMNEVDGSIRIRGLAGSGKTVILAMKAALTHLKNPNAKIVYTFYTKSLYQHIKRLITRFYRQYDDKDPDWTKLEVLHAWGGTSNQGLYYNTCKQNNAPFYNYPSASSFSKEAFKYACDKLIENTDITPIYDYIFIDEGQDFPTSFFQMCLKLLKNNKLILAYDELQTIFQFKAPTAVDIFGITPEGQSRIEFEDDIILYKCYRNPREILVIAHALGFGIYGKRIVQMLENEDYWKDIGYKIIKGKFIPNTEIEIERPEENSLETISKYFNKDEIVKVRVFDSYANEILYTAKSIKEDIEDGLLPEDILVITVDDKNAQLYLNDIGQVLSKFGIKSNNIHEDKFSIRDFQISEHVTLSTIHKAKGNEAYSVYILGIDALYSLRPSIKQRNLMFTAITRAKGWVTIGGIGKAAQGWANEIHTALEHFPKLVFKYPSPEEIKIMRREIKEKAKSKSSIEKQLDDIFTEYGRDEIERYLSQKTIKKGIKRKS